MRSGAPRSRRPRAKRSPSDFERAYGLRAVESGESGPICAPPGVKRTAQLETYTIEETPRSAASPSTISTPVAFVRSASAARCALERDERGRVQHGVAAVERAAHARAVGDVALHDVREAGPVRREDARRLRGVAHEQAHLAARAGELDRRVRADEARPAGHQHAHVRLRPALAPAAAGRAAGRARARR